jgi:multimeric flavodoxin WrbA
MNILAVSCSPRKNGATVEVLQEVLKGAREEGSDAGLYSVSGKKLNGCISCYACSEKGRCVQQDDMDDLYSKMIEADGIVFGTPIYYYGMTAQAKAVIDRTFSLNTPETSLKNKVGGIVTVAGSLGMIDPIKDFYFFFAVKQMLPASYVAMYSGAVDDLQKLEKGMKAAKDLGRQMVKLVQKKFEYPEEFPPRPFAFGTHTH